MIKNYYIPLNLLYNFSNLKISLQLWGRNERNLKNSLQFSKIWGGWGPPLEGAKSGRKERGIRHAGLSECGLTVNALLFLDPHALY